MQKKEFTMIQSASSSNPFECIASYTKSVDDIKHDANTFMALGILSVVLEFLLSLLRRFL